MCPLCGAIYAGAGGGLCLECGGREVVDVSYDDPPVEHSPARECIGKPSKLAASVLNLDLIYSGGIIEHVERTW